MINARHILIRPKVSPDALAKAQQDLNNVVALINMDSLSFEQAALKHSDDPSKNNGGIMVNPMTGTTRFETSQLDPSLFFVLDKMQVGETSEPVLMKTEEGTQAYRILFLKSRSQPHRANLNEDYTRIQEWALQDKQATVIQEYINRKTKNTYIRINERYRDCPFNYSWGSTED
ncbi:MAG: peptidylprolyl isomerase [Bacteroidales bacterium]|nr:peptidylprolyl isomerase [Bacteroidales bacterium]